MTKQQGLTITTRAYGNGFETVGLTEDTLPVLHDLWSANRANASTGGPQSWSPMAKQHRLRKNCVGAAAIIAGSVRKLGIAKPGRAAPLEMLHEIRP
jgi:hypothetical protein